MKNILNKIWDEFIYGGHFHSIGVVSLILTSSFIIGKLTPLPLLIIIYLGVHSGYLFNRYKDIKTDLETNPERTTHIQYYYKIIPPLLSSFFLIIIILLIKYGNLYTLIFGIFFFLIGLLYSILIKRYTNKIIGLKNYFISLSFSFLLIFYHLFTNTTFSLPSLLLFIFISLRVFNNTVFFDLKDITSDTSQQLKTYPVILGKAKTYLLLGYINYLSVIPIVIGVALKALPLYSILLIVLLPYATAYYFVSKKSNNLAKIAYIFADGEYVLWLLLLIFLHS